MRLGRRARRRAHGLEFVILTTGRTGSNHLRDLLDSHPSCRCFPELFNPAPGKPFRSSPFTDPFEYLRAERATVDEPVVGCKITFQDLRHLPELLEFFHDPALRVILLTRDNLLAQVVSTRFTVETGTLHSSTAPHELRHVHLEPQRTVETIRELGARNAFLAEFARDCSILEVEYCSLNEAVTRAAILRFLGLAEVELSSPQIKLQSRPLRDAIANIDEIEDALRGTPWERFLAGE